MVGIRKLMLKKQYKKASWNILRKYQEPGDDNNFFSANFKQFHIKLRNYTAISSQLDKGTKNLQCMIK